MNKILVEARVCFEGGDFDGAERRCRKMLRRRSDDPEAAYMLAILSLRKGDAVLAAELISRALDNALPRSAEVLENLGVALLTSGAPERAETALREALSSGRGSARLLMCLGLANAAQGRQKEALPFLREAWVQAPGNADIGINLGNIEAALGDADSALRYFRAVLASDPHNVLAWYNVGTLAREEGRFEEAIDAYKQVLSIVPEHVDALNNLGTILSRMSRIEDAMALFRRGLQQDPGNFRLLSNLAGALRATDQLDEAEEKCQLALRIQPDFVDALVTLAGIEVDRSQFEMAKQYYLRALLLAPEDAEIRCYFGMLGLALGDFRESWFNYRSRPSRQLLVSRQKAVLAESLPPRLDGITVVILGEQGIGDELFFLRWASVLSGRGARLRCVCDAKVHAMVQRTGMFDELRSHAAPLPDGDFFVAVGDLPLLIAEPQPDSSTLHPPPMPLTVIPERVMRMKALLESAGQPPFLAVTWRAGTPIAEQSGWRNQLLSKEVPIDVLGAALVGFPGTIISLQRNPRLGERQALESRLKAPVFDASAVNEDLEDMLALLGVIEEYVGVSNTNMHLLAALGREGRVLVPKMADWRWMASGSNSPWFPGFRLYRRDSNAKWTDAVRQLRLDLKCTGGEGC